MIIRKNKHKSFYNYLLVINIVFFTMLCDISIAQTVNKERDFNGVYKNKYLNQIAFPMGGIGAGMICLEGTGAISHVSLKHQMDFFNEPSAYAAICIKGDVNIAKVLEGPVPDRKVFGGPGSGLGAPHTTYGLPRFESAEFLTRFPFGEISLRDKEIPLDVQLTGWSPFVPNDPDASSLPVAGLEYKFVNNSDKTVEAVFSYNTPNFIKSKQEKGALPTDAILSMDKGIILYQGAVQKSPIKEFYSNSKFTTKAPDSDKQVPGLLAEYYPNLEFKGKPTHTVVNKSVNQTFKGFVKPGFPAKEFSARWTGQITVDETAEYMFAVSGDDGYRLYINDELIITKWIQQSETLTTKEIRLEQDKSYNVKLEYFQNAGGAAIRFGYGISKDLNDNDDGEASIALFADDENVVIDHSWFKGGWWDPMTLTWNNIQNAQLVNNPPQKGSSSGASLFIPFTLKPNEQKTISLKLAWYVPKSKLASGTPDPECVNDVTCSTDPYYKPWYAGRFKTSSELFSYWRENYDILREKSELFSNTFYDSNLPAEVIEAVAANLTILKSPTVLRQTDGKLWAWEGCRDDAGSCAGSCTHVWNYAQAIPHLFPSLERSLRETEFFFSQNKEGHQAFRSNLPISKALIHTSNAAADGQLGGIMKVYREWRISGDNNWVKTIWPNVKQSLEYCINTWDPREIGVLEEPHHNTYDIEYWGPNGHCSSFYLGALSAAIKIGSFCGDDVSRYQNLLDKGSKYLESQLYNGEYFFQEVKTTGLDATFRPLEGNGSGIGYAELSAKINKQGPKYQYGTGCLSDGVLGFWIANMCGLDGNLVDQKKIQSHLKSVYKYNLKQDLSDHANVQRPTYALKNDAGLLICTWPNGNKPIIPFVYSDEVWTGIEYQVASHLMMEGEVEKGLDIVKAVRNRYDGSVRNPFNEYECGHWYARALSSYGMLQGLTGIKYDAVDKSMDIDSKVGDLKSFFSTQSGWGNIEYNDNKIVINVAYGYLDLKELNFTSQKSLSEINKVVVGSKVIKAKFKQKDGLNKILFKKVLKLNKEEKLIINLN